MTEPYSAYISESYGAVHTGDGTQLNISLALASDRLRHEAGPSLRSITDRDGDWLDQRFVAPGGMQRARTLLRTNSVVLLSARPGAGRRAAALMLLHELADGSGGLYELPDTEDDSGSVLDASEVSEGDRLMLDLSAVDEARYLSLQRRLPDFRARLVERRALLAVVLPHHHSYLQRVELKPYTAELTKPSSRDVLSRYLQLDNIRPTVAELGVQSLVNHLARVPMREVAELADRIRSLRDDGIPGGFPSWRDRAIKRVADRSAEVAADLATHDSGRRRALLLALAMFHESPPATVLRTASALLSALSHPPDERPRLEQTDLNRELTELGAETGPDGLVRFRTHNYDRGVREHFWTYFPDLTEQLRRWFHDCLARPRIGEDEHGPAIVRFAEQCLRAGRPDDLLWLAEAWTGRHGQVRLIPDAAQALNRGLADEQYGQRFRQRIYDWSITGSLPQNLKQVLVLVCSETMRRSHPHQALVRLHHLDRRADGRVADTARTALLDLALGNSRMYRLLLQRVRRSLVESAWARDLGLFLALTQSVRLTASQEVRAGLTAGWAAVFQKLPREEWHPYAVRWFTAVVDGSGSERLLDVLVDGCRNEAALLGGLYQLARDWERSRPPKPGDEPRIVGLLVQKINFAQGLSFLVPAV
ncbi:hypothetical protein [Streptomyces sp. WM6378]|uniref:hypothetical protein n=1 Tax=Streptomyces sp. WM6378 TaxID=1415557 RepID=UPI0006AE4A34|nr:hypothetical protein [Streptomyces sp. WM6378]KOU52880.1 hypothetical protein ADK54_06190 [Streptomyces sp. WM6378]